MSICIISMRTKCCALWIQLVSKIEARTSTYWSSHIQTCMCNFVFMSFYRGLRAFSNTCHWSCLLVKSWSNSTLCNTYLDDRISILVQWASSCTSTTWILCELSIRASCYTSSIKSFFPWNPYRISICIIRSDRTIWDACPGMRISKIIWPCWRKRTSSDTFVCRIISKIGDRTLSYTSIGCLVSKS